MTALVLLLPIRRGLRPPDGRRTMGGTGPELTDRGRAVADRVADCYVEVSIDRRYHSREECRDLAASLGLDLVAMGVGRDIYAPEPALVAGDGECVLKVPKNLLGAYESMRELTYWRTLPAAVRRYLVPILDHGDDFRWLLMPWAEADLTSAEILELWSALCDAGYAFEDANWAHNLGRVDGRPVVLDYGGGYVEL